MKSSESSLSSRLLHSLDVCSILSWLAVHWQSLENGVFAMIEEIKDSTLFISDGELNFICTLSPAIGSRYSFVYLDHCLSPREIIGVFVECLASMLMEPSAVHRAPHP